MIVHRVPAVLFDCLVVVRAELVIANKNQNQPVHPGRGCPQNDQYVHIRTTASNGLVRTFVEPEAYAKLNHRWQAQQEEDVQGHAVDYNILGQEVRVGVRDDPHQDKNGQYEE